MNIIETKDLFYHYKKFNGDNIPDTVITAIHNMNIQIEQGSFVSIVGENGSGKSTFAKMLVALLLPSSGMLYIDGKEIEKGTVPFNLCEYVGMVFQNPDNQIVAPIVEEDVAFGPENLGISSDEICERVCNSLKYVEMLEYRNRSTNYLSGGQKQKIAIAGVLAMQPKCIILDEPTAMLDPQGRKQVIQTIRNLNKTKGITAILITHYMDEIVYSDLVYVMHKGAVVLGGAPQELFEGSEVLERYGLEIPQIMLLAHKLKEYGLPIDKGIITEEQLISEILQKAKHITIDVNKAGDNLK